MARKLEWYGWYESDWGAVDIVAYGNSPAEVKKDIKKNYPDAVGADGEVETDDGLTYMRTGMPMR